MNKPVTSAVQGRAVRHLHLRVPALRAVGVWAARLFTVAVIVMPAVALLMHVVLSPVLSNSMSPAFNAGDLIITVPEPVQALRPGDVAVFAPPGEHAPFAHRITSVNGDPASPTVTTKGDANPVADAWHATLTGSTVPVVTATVPFAGYPLIWAQEPAAKALFVGLLGIAIIALAIRLIVRRRPAAETPVPLASS